MLNRTKAFSLTIAALLVLTLTPGAPPTIAAPPEPPSALKANRRFVAEAAESHLSDFSAPLNEKGSVAAPSASSAVQDPLAPLSPGTTTRVSVASDGSQGNNDFWLPSISADDRYVTFHSDASNLVNGDTNGVQDAFVHDRQTGQTTRVSVASDGNQGNGDSVGLVVSADGRYVAFASDANNLVSGDTNGALDIFVHDRETEQTTRVSVASDGSQGNGLSGDASISADGRYVVFGSYASNLVSGDTNGAPDIFVHDRETGQTTRVSLTSSSSQGNSGSGHPSISANGRYVSFVSWATNLVNGDTNNAIDVFIHDRQTGQTTRVSTASDGSQGNGDSWSPVTSADDHYVVFASDASNLVSEDTNGVKDIFVLDRQSGQITRVSVASDGGQGNGGSQWPAISADGHYVAFWSNASNLVSDDTNSKEDVFVYDRQTGKTTRVSVASDGTEGNAHSGGMTSYSISSDGRYVAFASDASNLVSGDTNDMRDVFIHDREGNGILSISGSVMDNSDNPISDVTVSSSSGGSAATDASGIYTITGLVTDTYTIIPTKTGWAFEPPTRTVSVPPSATGVDFTGEPLCDLDKQPVLLVHGWGGPEDDMSQDEMGFKQLYQWMQADGYVEGCNLFYATGVRASNSRKENGQAIQRSLRNAYTTVAALNPDWNGHFDIIAHSYGGLNARFYLESSLYKKEDVSYGIHVDNLFTMGSPHRGAWIPDELFPGAIYIGLGHLLDSEERSSAWNVLADVMFIYNYTHSQPKDVCYRLIGGDFMQQDLPWQIRVLYTPWKDIPNDIGVSQRSSLGLGQSAMSWLRGYRNVVTKSNTDMHGYVEKIPVLISVPLLGEIDVGVNLSGVRSYVRPDLTYNQVIAPNLGADMSQCRSSQVNTRSAVDAQPEELATPPLLIASAAITGGETITGTMPVDWSGQTPFYAVWTNGDLDLTLRDPAGVLFTPTVAISDANADYSKLTLGDSSLATYIFTDTLTGEWTYTVTAASGPFPISFDLYVNPDSPLVARAYAPEWQPFGAPAVITASLFYSTTPVSEAAVQADVVRPDGSKSNIPLLDDGSPPDEAAGDGIYSGAYTDTTTGGFYYVLVEADGTYASQTYHRTAQAVFPVAADSATLSGDYADQPKDDNGDGFYEYLDVDVGVNATQLGDFNLAAVLQGKDEQYIDMANTTVYSATGAMTLTLRFDGQAIRASGLDGPYTVTEVLLVDDATLIKLDEAENAWVTPPYDHNQFGEKTERLYLPLVTRNYEPLRADFTASPLTGTAPLTVTFTNESSGVYTSSLWRFGDGFTSTLQNPVYTYNTPGDYTVTLTISGTGGTDTLTRSNYITVSTPITGLRYVAPDGADTGNDCTDSAAPCATVQHAVDASAPGDEVRVASGTYTDLHARSRNDITTTGVVTQVVYVSKTVSIRGGYTTTNWTTPDTDINTTTLDAQGQGRVLYVTGNISVAVEGMHITGGDSTGLGGPYSLWNDGGGAYVISATVIFRNNRVFDNIGDNAGGGLHLRSAHAVFSGNSVLSNTARYDGGGIFLWGGQATLTENTISNNAISDFGSDLRTRSPYAPLGGGAVCGGGIFLGGETTLTDNTITGNTADWDGGGVCSYYDASTLKDNLIADNTAGRRGGGMYVTDDVTMTGNIITGNTADGDGGGLALSGGSYAEPADVLLTNNVVANNRTSGDGSGIYVVGPADLVHTTIVSNSGGDSGIHVARYAKGTVALTNTILVSHSVGISVTEGNTVTINGILWHDTPITISQATTTTVTVQNQHVGDPVFAPDDYHLMADSAAIDRGVDTNVTTDIDGDSRPQGANPDLGADEYVAEARMRRDRSALLLALLGLPQCP